MKNKKKASGGLSLVIKVLFLVIAACITLFSTDVVPEVTSLLGTQTNTSVNYETESQASGVSIYGEEIPAYSGSSYYTVNGNIPFFTSNEITDVSFEDYPELDELGRCGKCSACLCTDTMPPDGEERGEIGMIKPSGWHTVKYDCVNGKYVYNRCHLIGWQLSNENANKNNLVTGTRYLNLEMLDFENDTADYIRDTGNHVMYRVTPVFVGNELVCRGLLMEGWSVEDGGDGICFCAFFYNVQPGLEINYATGEVSYTGIVLDSSATSSVNYGAF